MTPVDEIVALAERHEASGMAAVDAGREADALESADIARILREAASVMLTMDAPAQQDYAARMKAALWMRQDDSPVHLAEEVEP